MMLSSIHDVEHVELKRTVAVTSKGSDRIFYTREIQIDTKDGHSFYLTMHSDEPDNLTLTVEPDGNPTKA